MGMRMLVLGLAFSLASTTARAQTWTDLQAVPKETPVRIFDAAGKGWTYVDGRLLLVKDDELTILRGRRAFVIARPIISKVETRRRDSLIEGIVIGALVNIVLGGAAGGWQGCASGSSCVIAGITSGAALGALVDWRIVGRRTVYKAP
jgi:hypothetical protein